MAGNFGNFLDMDYEGDSPMAVAIKVKGRAEYMGHAVKNLAEDAARRGAEVMRTEAPRGETGQLANRIDFSDADWHPGGAGGGGFWEAVAGVIDTGDDYPLYVFHGTNEEGRSLWTALERAGVGNLGQGIAGVIRPAEGNVFPIHTAGGLIYRMWQRGQEPQQDWVLHAQEETNRFILERLSYVIGETR